MTSGRMLGALCVAIGLAGGTPASAGGDCTQTAVGLTPLPDLGAGFYQGFIGGLYPAGANVRPSDHEAAADPLARVSLLDAAGLPDAASGRIGLLTIGMSNTSQESQRFVQAAAAEPARNGRVVIVNGAQGGWPAAQVADPNRNGPYWATVDSRIASAGLTPLQVQAVWIKQAEARPIDPFPVDAQILQADLEAIVRILEARYPNTRQVFASSRIYAGYATTTLNPEPFAYQSGYSVKWMIERQIAGAQALNFDPALGTVVAPWLSWGPYLWADGLVPSGDGLTWACDELSDDGTHPSATGAAKVGQELVDFFMNDPVASRWFRDCDPNDPGVFAAPQAVLNLTLNPPGVPPGPAEIAWQGQGAVAGPATAYDLVAGSVGALRAAGSFAGAFCAAAGLPAGPVADPLPDPGPGGAVYYLIRARNGCGAGSFGEKDANPGPRAALDAASPC